MNSKTDITTKQSAENTNHTKDRLISMLVLAISFGVAESVLIAVVIGQVLFGLFAKEHNRALKNLAKQIVDYMHELLIYLSFNSDERPFPYRGWSEPSAQAVINPDQ